MASLRAQVTLVPTESKKLIGKAVARMDVVKNALNKGIVVIHPSTTTFFLMEEILGEAPTVDLAGRIVSGIVTPKGTCISREGYLDNLAIMAARKPLMSRPWVLKSGKIQRDVLLVDILKEMGPEDVYVKTGNALDHSRHVGVLVGAPDTGAIARAYAVCAATGVNLVIPIGLEKLIPTSIREASKEAGIKRLDYSMGMQCGLFPIDGIVVTEVEAVKTLTGAQVIPISSGGVCGAEGAITMIIKGEKKEVTETIGLIESIKGTRLPNISPNECIECKWFNCPFQATKH